MKRYNNNEVVASLLSFGIRLFSELKDSSMDGKKKALKKIKRTMTRTATHWAKIGTLNEDVLWLYDEIALQFKYGHPDNETNKRRQSRFENATGY